MKNPKYSGISLMTSMLWGIKLQKNPISGAASGLSILKVFLPDIFKMMSL
jgi:hypothetical protein